ncbi:helix-turn-helix domain-containing protein [Paraclostridium sordellii]|uniref:helix-turn-helix domain-containing protein n=1 Tax=Paraclostridium sordellii TaxID=1505 RepID=UPI0003866180|nr:helix-turn-helix transcriptional regulator [Paeniclostridium sordellii]MDU5021723.1 helix-turn-helix transcriptional regulator [Clostridiales bacterium]AUN14867.1 transcriptional regulator [Paeniclostridium sordellii]EPZ56954.1 helix-turn-helix domain protein [[Clostridium] sordellii VPI 9048] [Paeniclostridium sordellii VPI 9048]MBS6025252.1 helix-turn-helix transcriptional regulator [Paeniclostridium sordellii]MBX9181497.1 helix-turn-helix transcriptional regulator [Paeniclostridium sorde
MNENETVELMSILKNIDDESYLDEFVKITSTNFSDLSLPNFFQNICKEKGISKSDLIKNAEIDRTYGYQILNGTKKPSRDKLLKLCISASLDIEESNKALKLGNVGQLYPKNPRDSIIIFGINKKLNLFQIDELLFNRNFDTLIDS